MCKLKILSPVLIVHSQNVNSVSLFLMVIKGALFSDEEVRKIGISRRSGRDRIPTKRLLAAQNRDGVI